jgi:hypothetical protein
MRNGKRRRRPRLDAPEPLEKVLDRAGENRFARKQLPVPLAHWRAAVGPRIADRARPIALERGILIVKVVTSVWANELAMLAPQIIKKLAEQTPNGSPGIEVKSLRFRVGPLEVLEGIQQVKNLRRIPPPAALAPELERSLARVEDDDLRSLIERAARANLAWQGAPPRTGANDSRLSEAPPAARDPRAAGRGSVPPVRNAADSDEASRGSSEDGSSRRR